MYEHRLLTLETALARRHGLKKTGRRLVMTNGVFDILHRGHVEYLAKSAACGDELWIALNSDVSVRSIKGEKRPLVTLADRAELLLALRFVGAVIPFDEDTPAELYAKLLPDILTKGADYQVSQIAGADAVMAAGGKVELIELVPEHSTTNLVDVILDRYR